MMPENLYTRNLIALAKMRTCDLGDYSLRPLRLGDLLDYHELTSNDEALKDDYSAHQDLEETYRKR